MKSIVSIVIPTHNRRQSLQRTLKSLELQQFPLEQMEAIVVADGCTDDTAAMLEAYQAPFTLKVIEQPGNGAAVARNSGASRAEGRFLIFLDDVIEVVPGFVSAHCITLNAKKNIVVIGYLENLIYSESKFFRRNILGWFEEMFHAMEQKNYHFSYRNLTSGNFSVSKELFDKVNGFNTKFNCQEDYELGVRLIRAGAQFTLSKEAMGYHHEMTELNRSLHRKLEEGKAAVLFCKYYPEVIPTLPLLPGFKYGYSLYHKTLLTMQIKLPYLSDKLARGIEFSLRLFEKLGLRRIYQALIGRLLTYWYLRGVTSTIKSLRSLSELAAGDLNKSLLPGDEIELDIKSGIQEAEARINELQPRSLIIRYGHHFVGYIPDKYGYESYKGIHLRTILAKDLADPLLKAIAFDQLEELTNNRS